MSTEDYITAILTFLLGLAAKFVYDIWSDRRKQKSILFKKSVLSSFKLSQLEERIRAQTRVIYEGLPVESIHLVRVEARNTSSATIRNQAFTVRFDKEARVLNDPQSNSSSEDLRFTEPDSSSSTDNSRRMIIRILQKQRTIAWDFAVVNHRSADFIVEHGIASLEKDDKETDLDVSSTVTSQKIDIDLVEQCRLFIGLTFLTLALLLFRDSIASLVSEPYSRFALASGNALIIISLLFLLRTAKKAVIPLFDWLSNRPTVGDIISIGDITDSTGVSVGESASVQMTTPASDSIDTSTLIQILTLASARGSVLPTEQTESHQDRVTVGNLTGTAGIPIGAGATATVVSRPQSEANPPSTDITE